MIILFKNKYSSRLMDAYEDTLGINILTYEPNYKKTGARLQVWFFMLIFQRILGFLILLCACKIFQSV